MKTRLKQIIDYATDGNSAQFARIFGWRPQYIHNLLSGSSIGIQPTKAILEKYQHINARWFLFGTGEMLDTVDTTHIDSLEIEVEDIRKRLQSLREKLRETQCTERDIVAKNLQI